MPRCCCGACTARREGRLAEWEAEVTRQAVESVHAFMAEHPDVDVAGYEPDPALSMTEEEYNARAD